MNTKCIIGIHGLDNKPAPDILRDWWTAAIAEGLSRNCRGRKLEVDFRLVYWADRVYPAPTAPAEMAEPYVAAAGSGPLPRAGGSIGSIAATRIQEGVGKVLEVVFGAPVAEDAVRDALKTRYPDLHRYTHDRATRDAVRERLREQLRSAHAGGGQIMLIAHSMGSIIAYDVLAAASRSLPGLRIAHFVTVGSPLGLAMVKETVAAPLRVPACVARWSNFADPRDHVARWDTRLSSDYRANRAGVAVSDHLVINGYVGRSGKPNPHKIYGYLRTPEISELIASFESTYPTAIHASEAPARVKPSNYPEPFASRMSGRRKHPLGDLFGLANFGVNITRLAPKAVSALRHAHTKQDEFIYVLEGHPTLHTDEGRTRLSPGMCAGFKSGTGNGHCLINETSEEVVYLEVGDRTPGDEGSYPDDDLKAMLVDGKWKFAHKNGTPY